MSNVIGYRIISIRDKIVSKFNENNWLELGLLTDLSDEIISYPRLLRSLDWGDSDYPGNALGFLKQIVFNHGDDILDQVEEYIETKFPEDSQYISARVKEKRITFSPDVFDVPTVSLEHDLAAVMMPFSSEFKPVYESIQKASRDGGFRCLRADDIWNASTIVQDIFELIFRSKVIIVDFSGKNPNVMYETGIAHTLGKLVIPICQSISDVPSDISHHRVLKYFPNQEGLLELEKSLARKLSQI